MKRQNRANHGFPRLTREFLVLNQYQTSLLDAEELNCASEQKITGTHHPVYKLLSKLKEH